MFTTKLIPGDTYQLCEVIMPGFNTNLGETLEPPQEPFVLFNGDGENTTLCINFTVQPGETKVIEVNNTPPPGLARTIGFWRNWASCKKSKGRQAPILDQTLEAAGGHILIGDLDVDTCEEAVAILSKRSVDDNKNLARDPAFGLAAQLLAAKLNVVAGAFVCQAATDAINQGQMLLDNINFNGTATHGPVNKQQFNQVANTLDLYNNNLLCF
jgi:hypothetical protein